MSLIKKKANTPTKSSKFAILTETDQDIISDLQNRLKQQHGQIGNGNRSMNDLKKNIKTLSDQYSSESSQLSQTQKQLDAALLRIKILEDELALKNKLQQENDQIHQYLEQQEQEINKFKQELDKANKKIEEINNSLFSFQQTHSLSNREIDELKQQNLSISNQNQIEKENHINEINSLNLSISQLVEQQKKSQQEMHNLQPLLNTSQQQIDRQKIEISKYEAALQKQSLDNSSMLKSQEELNKREIERLKNIWTDEKKRLLNEIDRMRTEYGMKQTSLKDTEIQRSRDQAEQINRMSQLQKETNEIKMQLSESEKKREAEKIRADKAELIIIREKTDWKNKEKEYEDKIITLRSEHQKQLNSQRTQFQNEINSLNTKFKEREQIELNKHINELQKELDEIRLQLKKTDQNQIALQQRAEQAEQTVTTERINWKLKENDFEDKIADVRKDLQKQLNLQRISYQNEITSLAEKCRENENQFKYEISKKDSIIQQLRISLQQADQNMDKYIKEFKIMRDDNERMNVLLSDNKIKALLQGIQALDQAIVKIERAQQAMEADMICMNCFKIFDNPVIILKCGHTICEICSEKIKNAKGEINCIECQGSDSLQAQQTSLSSIHNSIMSSNNVKDNKELKAGEFMGDKQSTIKNHLLDIILSKMEFQKQALADLKYITKSLFSSNILSLNK